MGESCQGPADCCNGNCADGQCQCTPVEGNCGPIYDEGDCCSGICATSCVNGPGGQCQGPADCSTNNCVNGNCASCGLAGGMCGGGSECCSTFACGVFLYPVDSQPPAEAEAMCCGQPGAECNESAGGAGGCCGSCNGSNCVCQTAGQSCYDDQGCCPGGACLTSPPGGLLECCQLAGQACFSQGECCTGNCGANSTCVCVADGGQCGPIAQYAPLGPAACCSGACGDAGQCL
jgi:hypothetical protein